MGIYLPNMEMPIDGNETIIRIQPDGTVLDQYGHHLVITAVHVPPHGRLIDADALDAGLKEMSEIEWNQKASPVSWAYAFDTFRDIIERDEPTIIPAEEGET